MNELALFAGAGGGILGGKLLGWRTICAVEINPFARRVLLARQADGCLERFPIWDDIRTFNGTQWRGAVDVVSGGFPCQDISSAGERKGIDGKRSGLWAEMARIIGEVQPSYVWVENSPMLTLRGLDRVLWDLAAMGFDARWGVVSARSTGMDILRERIWIVACPAHQHVQQLHWRPNTDRRNMGKGMPTGSPVDRYLERLGGQGKQWTSGGESDLPPYLLRVDHGLADALDRIAAIGNGQVPAVAASAWRRLRA